MLEVKSRFKIFFAEPSGAHSRVRACQRPRDVMAAFLNRQTKMTLKCMSDFRGPIPLLFNGYENMPRAFDADNMWPTESQSGPFRRSSAFMRVEPIGEGRQAVRRRANESYGPVPARPADELNLPAAKSRAATTTTAVIVQRFPFAGTNRAGVTSVVYLPIPRRS